MSQHHTLSHWAQHYLEHRRAMGFALKISGALLMDFAHFADRAQHRGPLTTELALRWAGLPTKVSHRYRVQRLSIVRAFARYLVMHDPRTEVPDRRLLGNAQLRCQPHIYSEDQLRQFVLAAAQIKPTYALRPQTYSVLFGLLASTGLRISEALELRQDGVDLDRGLLHVVQTKFRKSRIVPLHPTTTLVMRNYAQARDRHPLASGSGTFFIGQYGHALPYSTVRHVFRRLCDRLGWRSNGALPRPRIHDLRHSFACRRLMAWYEQGVDVNHAIAALSTYLGHGKVTDTYWYLTGTVQLMGTAGARFERFANSSERRSS